MKLFEDHQIKKQKLNSVQGGADAKDSSTKISLSTLDWLGPDLGWVDDYHEVGDDAR